MAILELASITEVMLFNKQIKPDTFGLSANEFDTRIRLETELVTANILQYLNRTDLTADDLEADPVMANVLKYALINAVSNRLTFWKQNREGQIIKVDDMTIKPPTSDVLTKDIKEQLKRYRYPQFGTCEPDASTQTRTQLSGG